MLKNSAFETERIERDPRGHVAEIKIIIAGRICFFCAIVRAEGEELSNFGWSYLSRNALRRAEHQLSGAGEGVRDEIGFLILHQRYADYFFPGTSVLHTRLRYALFIPWIYQTLFEEAVPGRVADRLERQEVRLAGRLKDAKERGVIGGLNHPKPTTQPPSVSYWAALGTWGILRQQDGRLPSRAQLHALLQRRPRKAFDDDGQALHRAELPFSTLPPRPPDWAGSEPMTFKLMPREAEFLYRQLIDLRPAVRPEHISVLAKLAAGRKVYSDTCYSPGIAELAKEDAAKLSRAGQAAAMLQSAAPSTPHSSKRCAKKTTVNQLLGSTVRTCRWCWIPTAGGRAGSACRI